MIAGLLEHAWLEHSVSTQWHPQLCASPEAGKITGSNTDYLEGQAVQLDLSSGRSGLSAQYRLPERV
jgi:hypothetical protein